MRVVIQRVTEARVSVGDEMLGSIGPGLCILLGIGVNDSVNNAEFLASRIASLRIFDDEQGKMNRSVRDIGGELLVVSQFTLYGDCRKGNRPSFSAAAPPETAKRLYDHFVQRLRQNELKVATGEFRAHMRIALVNDGPVTLILENVSATVHPKITSWLHTLKLRWTRPHRAPICLPLTDCAGLPRLFSSDCKEANS